MIAGKRYNGLEVDIWSSGVTLYAMLCGYLPFEDPDTAILYRKILKGDFEIPNFLSSRAEQFLKGLLCTDPKNRLTLDKIKKSAWYTHYSERTPAIEVVSKHRHGLSADAQVLKEVMKEKPLVVAPNISYDAVKAKANQTDVNIPVPKLAVETKKNQTVVVSTVKTPKTTNTIRLPVRNRAGVSSAGSSQEPRLRGPKTKPLVKTKNVKPAIATYLPDRNFMSTITSPRARSPV